MRPPFTFLHAGLCAAGGIFFSAGTYAGPPVVTGIDVRGLQIGGTTSVTITGTDLLPNPRLLTTALVTKQTVRDGAKPERIVLDVELAEGSQPGFENGWVVTDNGVSSRYTIATDRFPQKPVTEKAGDLPAAFHGSLAGSQVREMFFAGTAGQEITCEVEAQRLESKLRPVLKLYGPDNALLGLSLPRTVLRGDTRLETKLPADGMYRIQLHDLQFAAAAPSFYRLKVGRWFYADLAFPATIQRGMSSQIKLLGPAEQQPLVQVPSSEFGSAVPAPWSDPAHSSGPQPAVWLSDLLQVQEKREGSAPQTLPPLPFALNGSISKPGEEDVYELNVEPESEIKLEVAADSLGSPIDAELELRDLKGARISISDDSPDGPDPVLSYKVPAGVTKVLAVIRDVNGIGGSQCLYHFRATLKTEQKAAGFSLRMTEDSHTVEPGRSSLLKVEAVRDGYEGPIQLAFDRLPNGVTVARDTIAEGATASLVTFVSDKPLEPMLVGLKGRANGKEVAARFDGALLGRFQPWLESDLAIAGGLKSEIQFSAGFGKGVDTIKIPLSGKVQLPVQCIRPVGHDGPIRLTLLTSQGRLFTKGAVDATKMLREEKAILIEEDTRAQKAFDAVVAAEKIETAARVALDTATKAGKPAEVLLENIAKAQAAVEGAQKAAVAAAKDAKNGVEFALLVPAEMAEIPHQIAFKAELLKRDRRTVEAVTYTSVAEVPVVNPFVIKIKQPEPVKLDAKTGATVEVSGQVERLEGGKGEVALTLSGLPAGATAVATATVKAQETQFKFVVKFPGNFKPGEFSNVKISGTGKPFGVTQIKCRDVFVGFNVLPPDPPAQAKPSG